MAKRVTRIAAFAVLFLCADARQLRAQQDYITLIERYGRCDDRAPYDLLEQPTASWLRQIVPPGLVGTAIVLHTHAAILARKPEEAGWHLQRAGALFETAIGERARYAPRTLYLNLYVLKAAYFLVIADALRLRDHVQVLPPDLPRETGLLLRGSAAEFYDTPLVSPDTRDQLTERSRPASQDRRNWTLYEAARRRDIAIRLFREALAIAPDNAEAHVRLGRLLLLSTKPGEAEDHLRRAAQPDSPVVIRYWASLLLGRLLQQEPDAAGAEAAYREAVRLQPSAQTPRLALAQLLWTTGRSDLATDLVDIMISNSAVADGVRDPWWDYFFGPYWRRNEILATMQQQVRRCR